MEATPQTGRTTICRSYREACGRRVSQDHQGGSVKDESVAGLIQDLGTKLSAIATEFQARATRLAEADSPVPGEAPSAEALAAQAKTLLGQRKLRRQFLPPELFHEPAWDMLIALFVSHNDNQPMNIKALVAMADAPVTTSQRWIEHLYKLRLIDRVIDPADRRRVEISLSNAGYEAVKGYLSAVAPRR